MSSEVIIILVIFLFFLLLIGGIFLIAYVAAQSRKRKQKKLLNNLPSDVGFHAFVRFNHGNEQGKFMKIKAFQGSGILFVQNDSIEFRSTQGIQHRFDLANSTIQWEGENLVNGLLKWFSINDENEKYFFNVETGMFIFHTGGNKPTTRSIYDQLILKQSSLK